MVQRLRDELDGALPSRAGRGPPEAAHGRARRGLGREAAAARAQADRGARGETRLGPLRAGFDVVGLELRYRGLFTGIVDVLEPDGETFKLRGTYRGRTFGRFRLVRAE